VEAHESVVDVSRRRLLDAMAEIVGDRGYESATVTAICARAGLSRQTFYQRFESREACFIALLDQAYGQGEALVAQAFKSSATWRDGLREAFAAILCLFESRPGLARVWMIESITAGPWALAHRERRILQLTESIVEYWTTRPAAPRRLEPLIASTVMAAVVAAIQRQILTVPGEPLIDLLGPLMGIATRPFLDRAAVADEIRRGEQIAREISADAHPAIGLPDRDVLSIPTALLDPRAHRARAVLSYLISHRGASNRELARGIGIVSDTQMSVLLKRLAALEMVHKQAGTPGRPNSSTLTANGEAVAKALNHAFSEDPYTVG
jgi:AcrR family transcriptional regulator